MDNFDIFRRAATALQGGHAVTLVTITAAVGSTPGKVGYKMLVLDNGRGIVGTVGGGWVEAQLIDQATEMLGSIGSRLVSFDLGNDPDELGGICGGRVECLLEALDQTALPVFQEISALAGHDPRGVLLSLITPHGRPRKIYLPTAVPPDTLTAAGLDPSAVQGFAAAANELLSSGSAGKKVAAGGQEAFLEPLVQPPTLVLCGAGHVAYHIARFAKAVHFRVVVCDDRPEYAHRNRFPDADAVIRDDFSHVIDEVQVHEPAYIVIVTRGHAFDEMVLERALQTKARYIGMIGSQHKTRTVLGRLADRGVPQASLDRVYAPIGLSIGAATAEEIALSIVCELVKIRRLGDDAPVGHMTLSRPAGEP